MKPTSALRLLAQPAQGPEPWQAAGLRIEDAVQAIDAAMIAIFEAGASGDAAAGRNELQALHLCLSAAAGLLGVSEILVEGHADLQRAANDADAARQAARRAVLLLSGTANDTVFGVARPLPFIC